MPANVKLCVNGFVLSTLLFDCTNSNSDQEGLLYGSVTRNVRREISDHSMSNTQEDILISVCSSVPSGSFLSFYNNVGEINEEELHEILPEKTESIVGWYRFRRYSPLFPSMREHSTHTNLRDLFETWPNVDPSYFIFAVLSSSNVPNQATHSYDYGFFLQNHDGYFKDLPMTILNLGDTRNSYRSGSMALPFMNSPTFNSVLSSSWNFATVYETENQILQFHSTLRSRLESLQEELAASDAINASLEDDIKRISNEMQNLLATQERLASAKVAAATRELEFELEHNEFLYERMDFESDEKNRKKEIKKVIVAKAFGSPVKTSECAKASQSNVETGKSALSLKRASLAPVENHPTKRVCPDKYFDSGECHDELMTSPEVAASSKQEESTSNQSQVLVVDPDNGELSSQHEERDLLKPSGEVNQSPVPSPASNVEIIMSDDSKYQKFRPGFPLIVAPSLCSSDDDMSDNDTDIKGSEPLVISEESGTAGMQRPHSVGLISRPKATVVNRCTSAPAEFLGEVTGLSCEVKTTARVPPFIIYASKQSGDFPKFPSPAISGDHPQKLDLSSPRAPVTDEVAGANEQSLLSPAHDQEHESSSEKKDEGEKAPMKN